MALPTYKLKLAFIPYISIMLGFIILYSYLHWLIILEHRWITPDEMIGYVLYPALLLIPVLFLFLFPSLNKMVYFDAKIKRKYSRKPLWGLLFSAWVSILPATGLIQSYIEVVTGALTFLSKPNDIDKKPYSKYYHIKQYGLDRHYAFMCHNRYTGGKGNRRLYFESTAACPLVDTPLLQRRVLLDSMNLNEQMDSIIKIAHEGRVPLITLEDTNLNHISDSGIIKRQDVQHIQFIAPARAMHLYGEKGINGVLVINLKNSNQRRIKNHINQYPTVWLAVQYKDEMSNSALAEVKDKAYTAFVENSGNKFDRDGFKRVPYWIRLKGKRRDYMNCFNAVFHTTDGQDNNIIFLEPVYEDFASRAGNKLLWIFVSLTGGPLFWLISLSGMKTEEKQEFR